MAGRLAVIVVPIANLRARPAHQSELKSQRWHGEIVKVRARRGLWFEVAGWDGYTGWVRHSSIAAVGRDRARAWHRAARVQAWGHAVVVRDETKGEARVLALLPWGALVEPRGLRGTSMRVRLADGRTGVVRAAELRPIHRDQRGRAGAPGGRAAELALAVCGTPYLWGGTTSWGFDCSGLVQWAYALAGKALPRDAEDQIKITRRLAAGEAAQPGDLLFFAQTGKVGHVALLIQVRPLRFVHAYSRVEEGTFGRGELGRPELEEVCLGFHRP